MIVKGKTDYEFEEDRINFRIYYREDKVIVKAKQGNYMLFSMMII
jgi:hypothetical protein